MTPRHSLRVALGAAAMVIAAAGGSVLAQGVTPVARNPDAIVDLATAEGVALVRGEWRQRDASIVSAAFRAPGPDMKPSGAPVRTHDVEPKPGGPAFDDEAAWARIEPASLTARRGTGRLAFTWYRLRFTMPARVGDFDTAGSTVVFEIVVDDYAEVWVDGRLPRAIGASGGRVVGGYNTPNRVVVTTSARPGEQVDIAVFGANGPLSDPPSNFIWIRSATLDFHRPVPASQVRSAGRIERLAPDAARIVPEGTRIERLAGGFQFTEGPVWVPDGYLLFSDPNANTIYRWAEHEGVSVFRPKSGYTGADVGRYAQPGSNGLALDAEGRLTVAEHGNRRITRTEKNGVVTVLADRFEGRRLNSPNDLVYRSDGTLYFTDPPFGLPNAFDDPQKELPFSGVFRYAHGRVSLVARDLSGPNGIAFSPDEGHLYVGNWDEARKVVVRYDVQPDGSLADGVVFFDMTAAPGEDAIDGIEVDREGTLFVSGPGGVWVLSPDGRHLATIVTEEHAHNLAWGDADGRTLYLTGRTSLYRLRLAVPGVRPGAPSSEP